MARYGAGAAGLATRARLHLDEPLNSCNKSAIFVGNHWIMEKRSPHSSRDLAAVRGLVFGLFFGALWWIAGVLVVVGLMRVGW
jgi:predicted metal-binding membrane protein